MQSKSRTALAAVWPPTASAAREAGHQRQSPLRAIREKCIDCSGGLDARLTSPLRPRCFLSPFRNERIAARARNRSSMAAGQQGV
jgi:hypothetical protein